MGLSNYVEKKAGVFAGLSIVAGLAAVFLLPWYIPSPVASTSMSYTYGFNNTVAMVAMAALLAVLFLIFLQKKKLAGYDFAARALSRLLFDEKPAPNTKGYRFSFLILFCLVAAAHVIWYGFLTYRKFGDYRFFVGRLDLMALGFKPYRDFEFIYGPGMLYPAYWLHELTRGGLSVDDAYLITLVGHWMVGMFLLYYAIGNLCGRVNKTFVFLCIVITSLNFSMGLNYTLLRFIPPFASLIFLHRVYIRDTRWSLPAVLRVGAAAFLLPLANFSISPEMGVACLGGIVAYFIVLARTPLRVWAWLGVVPIFSLIATVAIFSSDYLDVFGSRLSGSEAVPVFPTLHFLLFGGAACWLLPQLGVLGVSERNQNGAFAMALLIACGLQLPTVLGRCDAGHIFFNGLGVLILFLAVAQQLENKLLARSLAVAFILIFPLLDFAITWYAAGPVLVDAYQRRPMPDAPGAADVAAANDEKWRIVSQAINDVIYTKLPPFKPDLLHLLRYKKIGMPFECSGEIDCFIKLSGRYFPEYYTNPSMQVSTQAAIDRKLRDLAKMDVIIVPKRNTMYLGQIKAVMSAAYDSQALKEILFFPVSFKPSTHQLFPEKQIMEKISSDYVVVEEFSDNLILARKGLQKSEIFSDDHTPGSVPDAHQ